MTARSLMCALALLATLPFFPRFTPSLKAANSPVWQIGTFDGSSREFASGANVTGQPSDQGSTTANPLYVVGKSDPRKDWPAFQPGTSNGKAGHRAHPFTIQFDLNEAPKGLFTFTASLLAYSPRVPRLELNLNGHRGWFYQHPRLNYSAGDLGSVFAPRYSLAAITCEIPTRFLTQGTNHLVLTAIDEPDARDDSEGAVMVSGNSGIHYDALKLENDSAGRSNPTLCVVEVIPTIFYKSQNGQLREVIEAFVRLGERANKGRVTLVVGKEKFEARLTGDREFGEQKVEFEVPEFTSETTSEIKLQWNGRSRRFPRRLIPGKKWNVFIVPHEHLDIGYSDFQGKVAEVQSRAIDEAMDIIQKHPDFRFSIDGYWSVEQFLANRSTQERERFLELVRTGKLFVPGQYASNLTGLPTVESLIRSLYAGFRFNREQGGRFDYANISDVPSYTWSYASILASAGLKYFLHASNGYRGPFILQGRWNEKSPWWWEGPDGQRILTWSSLSYHQSRIMFGLPPQVPAIRDSLPIFLQSYSRPDYKSDGVLVFGTQWENTDLNPDQLGGIPDWNRLYAYPRIHFSGVAEALAYIAGQMGNSIPVIRGDGGPYWEDGAGSDAYYTALARQNEYRALSAEKFSVVSSLVNPRLRPELDALRKLWENILLFDEHTWEADRGVSDPESQTSVRQRDVKDARATDAKRLVDHIVQRSMSALADFIPNPSGTLVVFNSLSWTRSGLVETDLDKGIELVDLATRQTVPYEVLTSGKSIHHVRFLALDVPAVGYKCYQLHPAKSESKVAIDTSATSLENRFYRIALDPASGAIRSILDKDLHRELVDGQSPYRFNQYAYVTGADEGPNRLIDYSSVTSPPKLTTYLAGAGKVQSVVELPFATVARLESSGLNTPQVESEIILLRNHKKIEILNHVHKNKSYKKEGIYFAFPFAMDRPQFRYAIQTGYVDPAKDALPGAGREWFSVQQWVSAEQSGATVALVPVDAPLITLGDVVRGNWPTEFGQRVGTVFSYVMNNYWDTNYVAGQGGEFTFRYSLTSGNNLDPAALTQMGWEELSPFEVNEIKYQDKAVNGSRPLDPAQGSFLKVDQADVVLVTWKQAEDEKGYILRFVETAGRATTVTVDMPLLHINAGWRCTAMEVNQQPIEVSPRQFSLSLKPYEISTVRIEGTPALAGSTHE
jgi:alpha-mannosidase